MKQFPFVPSAFMVLMLAAGPARAQTGELRLNGGAMTGIGSGGASIKPVTSASFGFAKSNFSFGPEVFYAYGEERIWGFGVVARLGVGSGRVKPYLVGSLGGNYWKQSNFVTAGLFTGSVGGGMLMVRNRHLGITAEARVHKNLQNYSGGGNWDFVTLTAGVRFGW
jgi:hypothetical protein